VVHKRALQDVLAPQIQQALGKSNGEQLAGTEQKDAERELADNNPDRSYMMVHPRAVPDRPGCGWTEADWTFAKGTQSAAPSNSRTLIDTETHKRQMDVGKHHVRQDDGHARAR